jgi:hypothetical protein
MKRIINYAIILILWIAAMVLWSSLNFPFLFWFLLGLHFVELVVIGFGTGREYGVGPGKSILMCMIFGFVWWLPLRRQMKAETFTNADFIREG